MQNSTFKYKIFLVAVVAGITFSGCKKFVETEAPNTQANALNVYSNDATAISVLTGIYSGVIWGIPSPNFATGTRSFSLLCGLSADEFNLYGGANTEMTAFYRNALVANTTTNWGTDFWNSLYDNIYSANNAITGLTGSKGLTEAVKKQLLGEAKFIRAFFYFYLVNLYGDVPLVTTTDYTKNTVLSRTSKQDIYTQIINDLQDAVQLLSVDYLDQNLQKYSGSPEIIRPTKWAASALLARVYLYNGDYTNAETQSTNVITNTALYDTASLNDVFLKNSKEAIWQLQGVKPNQNTDDSKMFVLTSLNSSRPVWLSDTLLNSFETTDLRSVPGNWVNKVVLSGKTYYYPYKYKNNTGSVTEYLMVLRLAEQYLIRAEARAQQGNYNGAQSDLNIIRARAGLPGTTASDKNSLLNAIFHERQIELFSEWGHRWLDLKRTNTVDAVMSIITPKKGGTWQTTDKLYPLPFIELQRGPNLTQNLGY